MALSDEAVSEYNRAKAVARLADNLGLKRSELPDMSHWRDMAAQETEWQKQVRAHLADLAKAWQDAIDQVVVLALADGRYGVRVDRESARIDPEVPFGEIHNHPYEPVQDYPGFPTRWEFKADLRIPE